MMDTSEEQASRIATLEKQVQDLRNAVLQSTLLIFRVGSISAVSKAEDKDKMFKEVDDILAEIVGLVGGGSEEVEK